MRKTVLDVGNCSVDHADIQQMIRQHFDADVLRAVSMEDVFSTLHSTSVHLILVNRRIYADPHDGIELVRRLKRDPRFAPIPVMILSNYPEFQREAVAAGAEPGFGKAELNWPETRQKLQPFLQRADES